MISIVIPAYNEERLLASCLDSLINQQTLQEFEVIVVDNNSTDNTKNIAESYKNKLNLHVFTEHQKGRGAARRLGFEKAKGEIILSTDADAMVPPDWVEQLIEPFVASAVVAVTGTCKIYDCSPTTNYLFNNLYQPGSEFFYHLVERHWCLIGPNFAIRRETYDISGGFNALLNCREDADLSARVSQIGAVKRINISVTFSGRRYRQGLLTGALPYLVNRFKELLTGREKIVLKDVR